MECSGLFGVGEQFPCGAEGRSLPCSRSLSSLRYSQLAKVLKFPLGRCGHISGEEALIKCIQPCSCPVFLPWGNSRQPSWWWARVRPFRTAHPSSALLPSRPAPSACVQLVLMAMQDKCARCEGMGWGSLSHCLVPLSPPPPPAALPCHLPSESSSTARFRLNPQQAKAVEDAHLL